MSCNVWIIDTSILCNILSIPNMHQDKAQVMDDFEKRIKKGDSFLLPYAVIVETGNHIGHCNGDRYKLAEKFRTEIVMKTLKGEAPWKLMKAPDVEKITEWIKDFPQKAAEGKGYGDYSIIKEWDEYRKISEGLNISIWSLDKDLAGYEHKIKFKFSIG